MAKEYKAGAIIYEDYLQGGWPIGAVLENDTGHSVEWRFRPDVTRQVCLPPTRSFGQHSAELYDVAEQVCWWERIPAFDRLGLDRIEEDPHSPPLDLMTPREWLTLRSQGAYARFSVRYVPTGITFDRFYARVMGADDRFGGASPAEIRRLRPNYDAYFLRPAGFRIGQAPSVEWLAETIEMLMDGIVGYRYPIGPDGEFDFDGDTVPIRASQRLRDRITPGRG